MGCGWLGSRSLWGYTPLGKARSHGYPWCSLGMRHTPAICSTDGEVKCCRMWSRDSFPLKDTVCVLSLVSNPLCAPPPNTLSPSCHPSLHFPPPGPMPAYLDASRCRHWSQARDQALPILGSVRAECPHCVEPAWSPTDVSLGCGAPVTSPHVPGGVGCTGVSVIVGESHFPDPRCPTCKEKTPLERHGV